MEDDVKTDVKEPAVPQAAAEDRLGGEIAAEAVDELRDQKNLEYLASVLHKENLLAAMVGAINGDLMVFAAQMQRMIVPGLRALPAEPGALAQVVPAVEAYGRVARQVERLSTLLERLERPQRSVSAAVAKSVPMEEGATPAAK